MKWPKIETIKKWRESGRMRRSDEIFWDGDRKLYDFWLHCVEDRIKNGKKTKS